MKKTCFNCAYYAEVAEAEPGVCDNERSPNYEKSVADIKQNYCSFYARRTQKCALQREIMGEYTKLTGNWKMLEKAYSNLEFILERYKIERSKAN